MKRYLVLFSFPCILIVPMILYQTTVFRVDSEVGNEYAPTGSIKRSIEPVLCDSLLLHLNTTVPILLIDTLLLEQIDKQECSVINGKAIRIGVDVKYLSEHHLLEDPRFEVWFFTNESKKDYLDFRTEPRKIIPKKFPTRWIAQVEVPSNIQVFLGFWKRAKFLDCMNLYIPRPGGKVSMQPLPSTGQLAKLRDELIELGVFPFLNGGTLLGWYRECSVIPHTRDMDIAVFSENYNPEFLDTILRNESSFRLSRKFGMLNDSYEMTLAPRTGYKVYIDLFLMYKDVENGTEINWVGGLAPDGTKYKYTYPLYDPWCSADLHGHIFWVTCSPNEKLVKEYGQLWYRDHPTNKYYWSSSGKNVKKNGKWSKDQMKTVYNTYG